ncbi:MAG TPA: nuclear transport factor 2 family protein [Dehalococcoidia bacterium]|nr:nuclear transport factor 2 family protein [Dehalococcoidia bacterium]
MPTDTATEALLAANDSFYRAFNQRDLEAMDMLWSQSAEVTCIHPGWNLLSGRESVMESWEAIMSNPEQPRMVMGGATPQIHGEWAVVICRELVGGLPLIATNVFVREGIDWRMVHHHGSSVALIES